MWFVSLEFVSAAAHFQRAAMLASPGEQHGNGGAGVGGATTHHSSRPVPGLVLALQNDGDLDKLLSEIQGRWVIIEFVAGWSAACTAMRQPVEDMAQQNLEAVFLHVDVDVLCSTAGKYGATRVPQYSFFWNGVKTDSFCGASERKLRQMLRDCVELGPCPVEVTYQERVAARLAREENYRKTAAKKNAMTQDPRTRAAQRSRGGPDPFKPITSSASPSPSRSTPKDSKSKDSGPSSPKGASSSPRPKK